MRLRIQLSVLLFCFIWGFQSMPIQAQNELVSPAEFLGYELGSEWTPHHRVMDYFQHVNEHSPLIELKEYGESYEGRDLLLAYIANDQNIELLEEIRSDNLKRTGLREGTPSGDKTAIVWLSYNVHGNEASSSEAAMKTLYELVRPDNSETKEWLNNAVVIMDPMINPDGRDRYVHWYKETAGKEFNAHGDAREHHEPWPGGRTNHYYFDLNRDWAWLTQKETRHRLPEYQKWMPHIHVDFHEQSYTSPYYFAPAAEPFHTAITDWQRNFQYTIGENNAEYFNENNWLYFTGEVFDLFYPSYGDTYPIFNGAIGMTYEQGGGGYAGLGISKPNGDTLTLKDRLLHHHTTGMSTVEISAQNAGRLVDEFSGYYDTARNNPQGQYKSFVIKGDNSPDKLQALFELLDRHKIQYGKAEAEETYEGYNYQTARNEEIRVTEDDYLISAYQPKSVLARVLFEPRPQLVDSVTYDITAWEQHYAFGLNGYALTEALNVRPAEAPDKEVDNSATGTPYAYLAHWRDWQDVGLLADMLKQDIKVRFAQESFTIEGESYQPGTLIITRGDNENTKEFDELVQELATNHNQQLNPVSTGFVEEGADFGSSSVRYMERPQVAVLSGEGTSSGTTGEIWHYFDRQIKYPVTMLDTDYFSNADLSRYDVLMLPSGDYENILGEERMEEVKQWVTGGGKLIAVGEANSFLANKKGFSLARSEGAIPEEEEASNNDLPVYGDQQRESISGYNAGSIFRITMDPSHPLAFGYDESYFSLKLNTDTFAYLEDGWNVGVAGEDAHTSGFVGYKAKEKLKNSLTFGVQPMGGGSVVYMVDNPLFRAFWHNGKLLFGNAVFMVGQ